MRKTLLVLLLLLWLPVGLRAAPGVEVGESGGMQVVRVDLRRYALRTGLAHDRVGRTEGLAALAEREGAVAAINGSFFQAYRDTQVKNPEQNLVAGGALVHRGGDTGCTLGVSPEGEVRIDPVRFRVEGAFEGDFGAWHGWWVNRQPGRAPAVTVFTPAWGSRTGVAGRQVVVAGGVITGVADSSARIPRDGFVVHFQGRSSAAFVPGRPCRYRVVVKEGGPPEFWERVAEAVGAGPRLVAGGRVVCDPAAEGFLDAKILTGSAARSAVGVDREGRLLLVAGEGTIRQMALAMVELGRWRR